MSAEVRFDESAACDTCGRFGAFRFDGGCLCADCYEKRGSCCPEFGSDDLWARDDETPNREENPTAPESNDPK